MNDPQNFFDVLQDVLLKKSGGTMCESQMFNKCMSTYMLCRYLSMNENLMPYAAMLQRYAGVLSASQFYTWAYNHIPKQRSGFIKYISKPKKEKKKKDDIIIDD